MKIAMIGSKGIPAHGGGVERHVEEIGKRMAAYGHEVTVYCRSSYMDEFPGEYEGMRLRRLPSAGGGSFDAVANTLVSSMESLLYGYDVVHYHALGPSTLSFIPRIPGKKVVATVHGLDWMRAKWGMTARTYLKLGEFCSARFPNRTITVSEALKDYYESKYKKSFIYIPNGVQPFEYEPPDEIRKIGLGREEYILFLARLVPEKGCHYLIEAYEGMETTKKLVISGGGEEKYVRTLKRHESGSIIFTGEVGGRLLRELYCNAALYVLPSEIEGMPISLLEAMSCGTPCLASDIPQNMEVLGNKNTSEYGYTFRSKDSRDLKDKLEYILSHKDDARNIGGMGRKHVLRNYSWDEVAGRTMEVYEALL